MAEPNTRVFETHEYHPKRPLRKAWFKASAREVEPGRWLVSMSADYMPSQENVEAGADPLPTMIQMHKAWRQAD